MARGIVIPLELMNVVNHGPTGVAVVSHMTAPAGEFPNEERIDSAEQHFAPLAALAETVDRIEEMLDFRGGKIRIHDEAGFLANRFGHSIGPKSIANRGTHPALPHNGVGDRFAGYFVPQDCRLALIRNADGSNIRGVDLALGQRLSGNIKLTRPNLLRVVFNVPWLGQDLFELPLCHRYDRSVVLKHDGTA